MSPRPSSADSNDRTRVVEVDRPTSHGRHTWGATSGGHVIGLAGQAIVSGQVVRRPRNF